MNEGDSAGGGHQGPVPAPPAVPERHTQKLQKPATSTAAPTAAAAVTLKPVPMPGGAGATSTQQPTVTATTTTPSIITLLTATTTPTTSLIGSTQTQAAASTTSESGGVRSFQQVFTQQQFIQQQKGQLATGSAPKKPHSITGRSPLSTLITPITSGSASTQPSHSHSARPITFESPSLAKRPKIAANESAATTLVLGGTRTYSESPIRQSLVVGTGGAPPKLVKGSLHDTTASGLRKRVVDNYIWLLRLLKERNNENVIELFHLQNGDVMMEKHISSPEYVNFSIAKRVDQFVNADKATLSKAAAQQQQKQNAENIAAIIGINPSAGKPATNESLVVPANTKTQNTQSQLAQPPTGGGVATSTTTGAAVQRSVSSASSSSTSGSAAGVTPSAAAAASGGSRASGAPPQGAEIKIPAIGATPVAVSTKLPDAVVQLTQQGHIPGRPLGGRHGMVFGQIPVPPAIGSSSVPLVPGGTPLVPCSTATGTTTLRRNGNGISQTPTPAPHGATASGSVASPIFITAAATGSAAGTPTPTNGGGNPAGGGAASLTAAMLTPTTSCSTPSSGGGGGGGAASAAQEFSEKAKQEVCVMQRISELQREGLWTEKRLPKLQEPTRPKAHWDYLLEEMVWLAADFAQERKWKKNAAKKCAKMVQKYFQDKANAAQKAEKAREAHLKRVAAFLAREVKNFWSSAEKLVEYKHTTKLEEKRKQALDQHLSFIVDQTEKFSQQLAEGMNKSVLDTNTVPSINSSRISSPKPRDAGGASDDEFRPESGSEDDEETIAKAEEDAADVREEVAALEKESQMDLDDFLNDLPPGYLENRDKIFVPSGDEDEPDDDGGEDNEEASQTPSKDRTPDSKKPEGDDKQAKDQMEVDEEEVEQKDKDNDVTTAEDTPKNKRGGKTSKSRQDKKEELAPAPLDTDDEDAAEAEAMAKRFLDSDDASTDVDDGDDDDDDDEDEDDEEENEDSEESEDETEEPDGLKSLLEDNASSNAATTSSDGAATKDAIINDAAALAESLQPKGNTLSSTNVVTPVPFLLKHSLREYQHIGLDWLVTMNERKLNGILADEMGLGKTIQTIALLAHLACVKGNWGPHLIVVPSSVMLNWEMEFKKWCPGFKILTYYGSQKERKMKRVGWTKPNAFHVCITSYKLVVQDQQSFRRKKWKYLILDEAQNIKNFKSQRWQLLLNFSTERRLLLTGTPLQNDLMELWSLMHFLMPEVFSSHREFKEWFSNPMTGMIEGNVEYNETLIARLHKVIRPFLLRRLKKEVEKQMPKKYEHVVMCRLSNRQRYLYDDFMSRAKTKETLQTGNLLSVINILMQLRKVCNHPNMFEVRPIISPFQMEGIAFQTARLVCDLLEHDPFKHIDLNSLNLNLLELELTLSAYVSYKSRTLAPSRKLIEEIDSMPEPPPPCPKGKYKFYIRVRDQRVQESLSTHSAVRVGTSPAMRSVDGKMQPFTAKVAATARPTVRRINNMDSGRRSPLVSSLPGPSGLARTSVAGVATSPGGPTPAKVARISTPDLKVVNLMRPRSGANESPATTGRVTFVSKSSNASTPVAAPRPTPMPVASNAELVNTLAREVKSTNRQESSKGGEKSKDAKPTVNDSSSEMDPVYNMAEIMQQRKEDRMARLKLMASVNRRRTDGVPIYGEDCRESLEQVGASAIRALEFSTWQTRGYSNCRLAMQRHDNWTLNKILKSYERRCQELRAVFANYVIYVPSVCAPRMRFYAANLASRRMQREQAIETAVTQEMSPKLSLLHPIISAMTTQFPDPRLIQYDCGKLQTLDRLLRQLKSEQHRVLIFTQMTKMLDVLEAFLNYHGHIYLRLDGSTRVDQRQVLMERFNGDRRIFCFILSTRSGGVGINLTGADTVIFYDSDWNPTMDAQAQDRCHRIGQTRDVHIYRLVSEKTIEVNILKKANQKRMLSDMAIEGGNFTTSYFKSSTIKDLFEMENSAEPSSTEVKQEKPSTSSSAAAVAAQPESASATTTAVPEGDGKSTDKLDLKAYESALAAAEDEQDVQATKTAKAEAAADLAEFDETIPIDADGENPPELSKADIEMQNLVKTLTPIERYAMRFVEETGAAWTAEQMRAAEAELEAQKREWEANRLAARQKEEEMLRQESDADEILTYNRKDASNQVNANSNTTRSNRRLARKSVGGASAASRAAANRQQRRGGRVETPASAASTSSNRNRSITRHRSPEAAVTSSRRQSRSQRVDEESSVNRETRRSRYSGVVTPQGQTPVTRRLRKYSVQQEAIETPTRPTRKTTRTSMAAAAGALHNSAANSENSSEGEEEDDVDKEEDDETDKEGTDKEDDVQTEDDDEEENEEEDEDEEEHTDATEVESNDNKESVVSSDADASAKGDKRAKTPHGSVSKKRRVCRGRLSMPRKRRRLSSVKGAGSTANTTPVPAASNNDNDALAAFRERKDVKVLLKRLKSTTSVVEEAVRHVESAGEEVLPGKPAPRVVKKRRRKIMRDGIRTQRARGSRKRPAARKQQHPDEPEESENDDDDATLVNEDLEEKENHERDTDGGGDESEEEDSVARDRTAGGSDDEATRQGGGDPRTGNANDGDDEGWAEDEDHSSYATAGDDDSHEATHSHSNDAWSSHSTQMHAADTQTTNSTYYNVSEETDTDNESHVRDGGAAAAADPLQRSRLSPHRRGLRARAQRISRSLTPASNSSLTNVQHASNHVDVHSPRTRSRGQVGIDLWKLDDTPILPSRKPPQPRSNNRSLRRSEPRSGRGGRKGMEDGHESGAAHHSDPNDSEHEEHILENGHSSTLDEDPLGEAAKAETPKRPMVVLRRSGASGQQQRPSNGSTPPSIKAKQNTLHRWLVRGGAANDGPLHQSTPEMGKMNDSLNGSETS